MAMKWIAKYKDGTSLHQFSDGKENLFKDINQEKLEVFTIGSPYKQVSVNLVDGTFDVNGTIVSIDGLSNRDEDYRLIYFRRVQASLGTDGSSSRIVKSFIGYQITIDGKNRKAMFSELNDKICFHME